MTRIEILRQKRNEVLANLADKREHRPRLLTVLMDIDDELDEMSKEDRLVKTEAASMTPA